MGAFIQWAAHGQAASIEDVGVDHRSFHVLMPEEFLHRADVVAGFQEMSGEGMAEGVGGDVFIDPCQFGRLPDRSLHGAFVEMVTACDAGAGVFGGAFGGKDVLPDPLAVGVGVLLFERVGEIDSAVAIVQVLSVKHFDAPEVLLKGLDEAVGEHGDAVFSPLAVAHDDLVLGEINVLDPQPQTLYQPQPRAVEQLGDQLVVARHGGEHLLRYCQMLWIKASSAANIDGVSENTSGAGSSCNISASPFVNSTPALTKATR